MPIHPQGGPVTGASTLIRNGLMQTDMDASFYRILNLDTSNLVMDELHTQPPIASQWFNSYNAGTHTFGTAQPAFTNLSGNLTFAQQSAITRLGTITQGIWLGSPIDRLQLPVLNLIRPPNDSLNLAFNKIINLADPESDQDAVNKRFVLQLAPGLQPKQAVVAATTPGTTIALVGLQVIDGVTLQDNDRVLVKDQVFSGGFPREYQNGIWNAHPGSWTRALDCDDNAEFINATCFVLGGTTNQTTTWVQTTPIPINIVVPIPQVGLPPVWSLFSTSIVASAGAGLTQTGTTISVVGTPNRIAVGTGVDIDGNYAGQTSITTLGTISTGEWAGLVVNESFGGTGIANLGTITIDGNFVVARTPSAPLPPPLFNLKFMIGSGTELTLPPLGTLATLNGNEIFTNKHISADQIDSGVLLATNGGTGANNEVDAINNLLPAQTGHAGQTLHTDGTNVYWA